MIEDEPNFARILFDLAHELGYSCLVAHGADEGYDLAKEFVPDAILLDMRLPDHSGLTVLERLKENPATRHIPVILVTTKDQDTDRMWGMRQGAKAYLTKPFSEDELAEVIERIFNARELPSAPSA